MWVFKVSFHVSFHFLPFLMSVLGQEVTLETLQPRLMTFISNKTF